MSQLNRNLAAAGIWWCGGRCMVFFHLQHVRGLYADAPNYSAGWFAFAGITTREQLMKNWCGDNANSE